MNVPYKYLRLFSVLFLLVCLLTACGRAPAAAPTVDTPAAVESTAPTAEPAADTGLRDDIVILYTNDLHTYIDGPLSYDTVAAIKQELGCDVDKKKISLKLPVRGFGKYTAEIRLYPEITAELTVVVDQLV